VTIRVAVVDEHEIFLRGVVACLDDDAAVTVVAQLAQLAQGVPRAPMDVTVASAEATATLDLPSPVVVCTNTPLAETRDNCVMAILPRGRLTRDRLLAAVHGAAVGLETKLASSMPPSLDDRLLQILRLLAEGADTREISQRLRYSPRTIKGLISTIEEQLDSRNRAHAVAIAIRNSFI
jgi:DNA-binding NarL/FixJ family response regulator